MNIHRKICVVFSNFVKKAISGTNFCKKVRNICKSTSFQHPLKSKEIKHLQSKYWKENSNTEYTGKIKNVFLVRLQIKLLIFMKIVAERDNLMRLYGWNIPYTWPTYIIHKKLEYFWIPMNIKFKHCQLYH